MDENELITSIENAFMDKGIVLEVECVTPKEVEDDVKYNGNFKILSRNADCIKGKKQWLKVAYGDVLAYVGITCGNETLEVLIDGNEDNPVEDFGRMIAEGIKDYAYANGMETVNIKGMLD